MAVHKTARGDRIPGIYRLKDGRWRASGPEKFTFTETDEQLAVAQFLQWKQAQSSPLGKVKTHPSPTAAALDMAERAVLGVPSDATEGEGGVIVVTDSSLSDRQWVWLRQQIYQRPKWVAQMVGIEQIAYLTELHEPLPSPTLVDVGNEDFTRHDVTAPELRKRKTAWGEFCRVVEVKTLRELTPEHVAKYGKRVKSRGQSPQTQRHALGKVKIILNHYRSTGKAVDDVRHALDCCAVLKAPEVTSLDPHPIGRQDFHTLLKTAETEGREGRAVLLVALNLCLYPIDIAELSWDSLDLERGEYHAKRGKTKVARCAVLWQRTIEALKGLSKGEHDDRVFHKADGREHTSETVRKWFTALRLKAGVSVAVKFNHLRDGSFTAAADGAGVDFRHAQALAGHSSGIADAYVLRNPKMAAGACAAVELAYFG